MEEQVTVAVLVVVRIAVIVAVEVVVRVPVVVTVSVVVIPHPLATNTLAEISTAAMMMAKATTRALREGRRCWSLDAGTLRGRAKSPDLLRFGPA